MPEVTKKRLPDLTSEEWFDVHQISVIDVRQVVDWTSDRAEINKEQIAVVGISFGGFISTIAIGTDKRIRAGFPPPCHYFKPPPVLFCFSLSGLILSAHLCMLKWFH